MRLQPIKLDPSGLPGGEEARALLLACELREGPNLPGCLSLLERLGEPSAKQIDRVADVLERRVHTCLAIAGVKPNPRR